MTTLGERIGPFELVERLSAGPRTSLWRATRAEASDHRLREVVVRVAENPGDAEIVEALRQEYEVLRAMSDDRLPRPVGFYAGRGAVATELVAGTTLREVLRVVGAGTLDLDLATALDLLIEIAYAMRHAHAIVRPEGRIAHGSLNADDVRLTADGRVVVCGFGAPDRPPGASPEQQAGAAVDARTDQWLLGALALDLLRFTKTIASDGPLEDAEEVLARLQDVAPGLHRVVIRMLARAPAQRHTPEDRMLSDLLAVARQLGGVSRRSELAARAIAFGGPGVSSPASLSVAPQGPPPTVEIQKPIPPPRVAPRPLASPPPAVSSSAPTPVAGVQAARPPEPEPPPPPPAAPVFVEEATEESQPPPPWRPPRVRSGAETLAHVPRPKHPAPPPVAEAPVPEPPPRLAPRPEARSVIPDWMVVATIGLLVVAGIFALWMRFGRG
jgi:serine/threonine protein kinase